MNTFLHQAERQLSLSVLFSEMSSTEETSHKHPDATPPPPSVFWEASKQRLYFDNFHFQNQEFAL